MLIRWGIAAAAALWLPAALADGCAHERPLNAAELAFIKARIAAAESAYPAPPAGWVRYQADAGLQSRVHSETPPRQQTVCDDWGPTPLRFTTAATFTPADSMLMRDLAWQREDGARKKKSAELQQQMTAAGQRGDYDTMTRLSQQLQALSGPVGSKPATPLSDEEFQRRSDELDKKLEQAQAKNDYKAIQAITGEQMALLLRQSGVDTSGVAAATPTTEQINAAPRVHVVVEYNNNGVEIPEGSRKISFGGAAGGFESHHAGWCYDEGGPAEKNHAVLLFGGWQLANDYKNDPTHYVAPSAEKGSRTSVATTMVTVCGDPATVDRILPAIKYSALK